MDALNQLPHVFIRGEQRGASYYLYRTWLSLKLMWDKDGGEMRNSQTQVSCEETAAGVASLPPLCRYGAYG